MCAASGCPADLEPIVVSADVNAEATAVELSWVASTGGNQITELRLVRCVEDVPCPTTFEEAAALDADALQWRARSQDFTEVEIPSLAGPIRYPDGVEDIFVVEGIDGNVNEPVPAPPLVPGARYAVLAIADASTVVVRGAAEGMTTFEVPPSE